LSKPSSSSKIRLMRSFSLILMCCFAASANAATWYVDSSATGSNNGTSWANAWTNVTAVSGVAAGDTVNISGGPAGQTRTYSVSGWNPHGGSASAVVTYQIGQDSSHNGTAIFQLGSSSWISGTINNVSVSGNAGDGNMHFQLVSTNGGAAVDASGSSNLHVSYVNYPAATGSFANFNGGTQIEIDHIYFKKLSGTASSDDHAIYFSVSGTGWDVNKIHDSAFYLPRDTAGEGDDCIQSGTSSISIYNNTIIGYTASYPRGQHQDGFQPLGGSYYKVYNNYFQDIANYPVFGDSYYGDFAHFWVYNNILVLADPAVQASNPPQGIVIGQDGGAYANMGRAPNFTDVVIANNLSDGYLNHSSFVLNNVTSHPSQFTSCLISNNVGVNGGGLDTTGNTSTPTTDNVLLSASAGSANFVSYATNSTSNNYQLLAGATSLIGQGANWTSYFTIDKNGKSRPATGAWAVGPYVYGGSNVPMAPQSLHVTSK
jgi:hypothetical protein